MKTSLALGLCLSVFLCVCRCPADELQWRSAPSSSSGTNVKQSGPAPAVLLNQPIPVSDGDFFRSVPPALVRAKNDVNEPDDILIRPLPSGATAPLALPMNSTPMVTTEPMQIIQPNIMQKGKVVPVPGNEVIPVAPTPMVVSEEMISSGETISSDSHGCGCGMTNLPIWGDAGGCGCVTDGGCMSSCCMDGCCWNSNRNHLWVSAEYLMWNFNKPNTPPLVTSGTAGQPTTNGITGPALGQAGTQVLYGQNNFNTDNHSGGRFTFGFWLPECDNWGLEFTGLYLGSNTTSFTSGGGIVGRPFLDVTPGSSITANGQSPFQSTELVNLPGTVNGNVRVDYTSRAWGLEGNVIYKLCCGPNYKLNLLFGYRNFELDENIRISENLTVTSGGANLPIQVVDSYTTHNSFNGAQVGLEGEYRFCKRFFVGGFVKVAVGDVYQSANISGLSSTGGGIPSATGVFANYSTNIGNYGRNQLGVLPEASLKIGMDVTDHLRIFVGYNVLFLSSVMRPGDAIDTTINTNNVFSPTASAPARPAFVFTNSTFWAQGVTAGLEYHY